MESSTVDDLTGQAMDRADELVQDLTDIKELLSRVDTRHGEDILEQEEEIAKREKQLEEDTDLKQEQVDETLLELDEVIRRYETLALPEAYCGGYELRNASVLNVRRRLEEVLVRLTKQDRLQTNALNRELVRVAGEDQYIVMRRKLVDNEAVIALQVDMLNKRAAKIEKLTHEKALYEQHLLELNRDLDYTAVAYLAPNAIFLRDNPIHGLRARVYYLIHGYHRAELLDVAITPSMNYIALRARQHIAPEPPTSR